MEPAHLHRERGLAPLGVCRRRHPEGREPGFHKGSLLADPAGLLAGDGKYTRQVPADRALAAPDDVAGLVREALAHQTDR